MSHACYDCRWNYRDFPCRIDGRPDPQVIAKHRVGHMDPATGGVDPDDEAFWSWECITEAVRTDPDLAWQVILASVPLLQTPPQAGVLAAGHLEDFVHSYGPQFIDRIEAEARRSPRFRFLLSGVLVIGFDADDPIRLRIERLQASAPRVAQSDPLPPV